MFDILKIGAWGAAGILIGLGIAIWLSPRTDAGFYSIIVVFFLLSIVLRGVWKALQKRRQG